LNRIKFSSPGGRSKSVIPVVPEAGSAKSCQQGQYRGKEADGIQPDKHWLSAD